MARLEKERHSQLYPDYRYAPAPSTRKKRRLQLPQPITKIITNDGDEEGRMVTSLVRDGSSWCKDQIGFAAFGRTTLCCEEPSPALLSTRSPATPVNPGPSLPMDVPAYRCASFNHDIDDFSSPLPQVSNFAIWMASVTHAIVLGLSYFACRSACAARGHAKWTRRFALGVSASGHDTDDGLPHTICSLRIRHSSTCSFAV
jgi:hypothetical protein